MQRVHSQLIVLESMIGWLAVTRRTPLGNSCNIRIIRLKCAGNGPSHDEEVRVLCRRIERRGEDEKLLSDD
nr:MAG TPA: hypothetical protein [Caudoviricetes sp.]